MKSVLELFLLSRSGLTVAYNQQIEFQAPLPSPPYIQIF